MSDGEYRILHASSARLGCFLETDRLSAETIRDVLDSPTRQRHPRPPLLPSQRPLRGVLGGSPRRLGCAFMLHLTGLGTNLTSLASFCRETRKLLIDH